jgi:large subunit ribosomal protein L24
MEARVKQHKFKLKKEDLVEINAGKDKGKRGRILRILREKDRVLVEGANIVKKARKRRSQQDRGGIVDIESSIHISNVQIVCKKCGPTRIAFKIDESVKARIVQAKENAKSDEDLKKLKRELKTRVCKKCGEAL